MSDQITIPAPVITSLLNRLHGDQLTPSSILTISNDGLHYKIHSQQPGQPKVLAAITTHTFFEEGAKSGPG